MLTHYLKGQMDSLVAHIPNQPSPVSRRDLIGGLLTVFGLSLIDKNVSRAATIVAQSPEAGACFAEQVSGPLDKQAAAASVMIIVRDSVGAPISVGSGFVVKDSALMGESHNRILTDAHVAFPPPQGGWVEVTSSAGDKIGHARIAATGTGFKGGGGTRNDLAVLALISDQFMLGQQPKYDAIQGIKLGPQFRGGYLTGLVSTPAGVTEGNSGGALLDANGEAIGVVLAGLGGSGTVVVSAPHIQHPYRPGTNQLEDIKREIASPNRMYATTVTDSAIRDALGVAGRGVQIVDAMPETPVKIFGAPASICIISSGMVKGLDVNSLDDFKFGVEPVSKEFQFAYWNDPARAAAELKSLLGETQATLPKDAGLSGIRKSIEGEQDFNKILQPSLPKLLIDWANQVNDGLAQRLVDASQNIDAWIYRAGLGLTPANANERPAALPRTPKPPGV